MDPVVLCGNIQSTAFDIDKALSVFLIVRMKSIVLGADLESAVFDANGILAGQSLAGRGDMVGSSGEFQIILADDGMIGRCLDRQGAAAVEGQSVLAEDDAVDIGVIHCCTVCLSAVGKSILSALCQRDKHLVRLGDQDAGRVTVREGKAIQDQLDLAGGICADDDLAVLRGTGEHIGSFFRNGHGAAFRSGAGALRRDCGSVKGDVSGGRVVIAGILIPAGEQIRFLDAGSVDGGYGRCRVAVPGRVRFGTAPGEEHGEHAHDDDNGKNTEDLFF